MSGYASILQKQEKQMVLNIPHTAFICSLQAFSSTYTSCILRWSSICLQITSSNPSRILFKKNHSKGIGTSLKATAVLFGNNEKKLWDTKVLNLETPTGLLHAVFFYNGKKFCLQGGIEQSFREK